VNLLGNRLVLIASADSRIALVAKPHFDLAGALGESRLALADPAAVPAGKYAKAALTTLGVWDAVANKVVPAENVRVALAYVARGEASLGIVYATDAKAEPKVRVVAVFPDDAYPRIVYPAALTKEAMPDARAFLAYLSGARARAIFKTAGFAVLGR
jgi:molybdate transport system substrate-binding protein